MQMEINQEFERLKAALAKRQERTKTVPQVMQRLQRMEILNCHYV
jgi:hypothetical protein